MLTSAQTLQPTHFMYSRQMNQPVPSPPPSIIAKTINQSRQNVPSKSVSPRPHHHPGSPGYASPPPNSTIPMTSRSSGYVPYPINRGIPVCQSSPQQIAIQSTVIDQQSSDVDELLSSFCSPADHTPSCSPQASPTYCNSVVHSDQMIEGLRFTDAHSGPVSPDEFNRYLPDNRQVVAGTFGSITSCARQQQDYANVYTTAAIGMVPPTSLGQFTQNP